MANKIMPVDITTSIAAGVDDIYRNTDYKVYSPHLIILTNFDNAVDQKVTFVDEDTTDSEGGHAVGTNDRLRVAVPAGGTVILDRDDLAGIRFKYGMAAGVSATATNGVSVQHWGVEL